LEKGSVEVRRGGKELAALGPGSTFGEMALLDPAPRSATVLAASDGVAWELGRDALWDMLAQGEPAAVRALQGLTATVCARLEAVNRLVQDEVVRPRGNVFSRLWKTVSGGLAGKR
jgi:CRP-like cAMP-binding protein